MTRMTGNEQKLHTINFGGNLHTLATYLNRQGWASYLVTADSNGSSTTVVLRMPAHLVWKLREEDKSYVVDAHHDDYRRF